MDIITIAFFICEGSFSSGCYMESPPGDGGSVEPTVVVWVRRDTSSSRRQGIGGGTADLIAVRCLLAPSLAGEGCSGIQGNAALCQLAWPNGERLRPSGEPLNPRSFSERLIILELNPPCYVQVDVAVSSRGFLSDPSTPMLQISSVFFRSHPFVRRQAGQDQRNLGILCSAPPTVSSGQGVIWFHRAEGDAALPSLLTGAIRLLPASRVEPSTWLRRPEVLPVRADRDGRQAAERSGEMIMWREAYNQLLIGSHCAETSAQSTCRALHHDLQQASEMCRFRSSEVFHLQGLLRERGHERQWFEDQTRGYLAVKEAELESVRHQCAEHFAVIGRLTAEKNGAFADKDKAEAVAAGKEVELESLRKQCSEQVKELNRLTMEKNRADAEKQRASAELAGLRQEIADGRGQVVEQMQLPRRHGDDEGRSGKRKAPVPSESQPPAKHGSAACCGQCDDLPVGPWQQLPAFRCGKDFLDKLR